MKRYRLTCTFLASLSTALIFSIPDCASELNGGRRAAEAASAIVTKLIKSSDTTSPSFADSYFYEMASTSAFDD